MIQSIELRINRRAHVPHLLISGAFVVVSLWLLIAAPTTAIVRTEAIARGIGLIGLGLGVYAMVQTLWLLRVQPGLELTTESVVVRAAGPPVRTVAWSDVTSISHGSSYTTLSLRSGRKVRLTALLEGIDRENAGENLVHLLEEYRAAAAKGQEGDDV